ncbi:MAG: 3-phosphoshikimate 1-carboxyvinyltransferase [Elusimicrobia bacterium RIFOXYD2_FULL_34_15]|nr:MAG: 3-phosphoshikimate 1-carboxyvinyltransferase [Elusimicrobia bacterium RIFOXYD2_FULL_34_15]
MPKIRDEIQVAPDKSISHRALMISAIAEGTSRIKNFLNADDCISTMNCLKKLGVEISNKKDEVIVKGNGLKLKESKEILDAGNSGTTVRLLSGILAGQEFLTRITGDESLSQRPMKRIVEPLEKMGACVKTNNGCLPIEIKGGNLNLIHYESKISSAQLKSCVLLAGLYADNITGFTEPEKSRDHTERMLKNFGAEVFVNGNTVSVRGKAKLRATDVFVPGDISSAAFFIIAAAIVKNSKLKIKNVGINSTRMGIVDVLRRMGSHLSIENKIEAGNEPMGDIIIESTDLKATEIKKEEIPFLIDEIPIIAVAATQANGITRITGAKELRVKECDRLRAISSELTKMGADITELEDGLIIKGPVKLNGAKVDSFKDHRIAMSLAIASLVAEGSTEIIDKECVNISFPNFWNIFGKMTK